MIKLVKGLFKSKSVEIKPTESKDADTNKYYKVKVYKYHGLQGFRYDYGVCCAATPAEAIMNYHTSIGGLIYLESNLYDGRIIAHLIPKGATLISKEEYLKGVENEAAHKAN